MKNQLVFSFFIEKNEGLERQQDAAHVHRVHLMAYGPPPRLELCDAPLPPPGWSVLLPALKG